LLSSKRQRATSLESRPVDSGNAKVGTSTRAIRQYDQRSMLAEACLRFIPGGRRGRRTPSFACNMQHATCHIQSATSAAYTILACNMQHTSTAYDVSQTFTPDRVHPSYPRSLPSTRNDCVGTSYRFATFRPRNCPKGRTLFGSRRPHTSLRFALTSPARDCPFLCAPRHRTTTGPPRSSVCCICVRFRALVFGALRRACQ
jgi:hypothetical protein